MTRQTNLLDLKNLLCFNIYSLNRSFCRFYASAFSETGLTYPKFVILMALDSDGPMSVSDLSARAAVEANTLSPLLKKMAEFGTISRHRAKDDERRVELDITPMGRQILDQARDVIAKGFAELDIDPARMAEAMRFLEDARAKVDQASPGKLRLDAPP
ncbi:MAG: MarR family transcriptional regulator [Pseudomonadota bacterium]